GRRRARRRGRAGPLPPHAAQGLAEPRLGLRLQRGAHPRRGRGAAAPHPGRRRDGVLLGERRPQFHPALAVVEGLVTFSPPLDATTPRRHAWGKLSRRGAVVSSRRGVTKESAANSLASQVTSASAAAAPGWTSGRRPPSPCPTRSRRGSARRP